MTRPKPVGWRKGSFGTKSEAGGRFVERIFSLPGTTRFRGINLLAWLILAEPSQATADWIAAAMGGKNPLLCQKVQPLEEGHWEQKKANA